MKQYGILAYPAKHSLSPAIHNAAFKELLIDAQYCVFEIPENNLSSFMDYVRHEPINGLSVSLPYKEKIMDYLDKIDDDAKKIGAVNTVLNKGGFLYGYNTDFIGSNRALKETVVDLRGKTCVVLGAGGSARAVVYGLLMEGANVFIQNRTRSKADKIVDEFANFFDSEVRSYDWGEPITGDVLINATSFWYKNLDITENNLPYFCDSNYLNNFEAVMDLSYNVDMVNLNGSFISPLLLNAKKLGKKIITGDRMLLYQAVEQFKIWVGKDAPFDVMEKAIGV